MPTLASWPDAITAITGFAILSAQKEPEDLRLALAKAMGFGGPLDRAYNTIETIYAMRDSASKGARDLAIDLIDFCLPENFHNLAESGRGAAMKTALARGTIEDGDVDVLPEFRKNETPPPVMPTIQADPSKPGGDS